MAGYGWQDAQLLRPGDRLLEPDQSHVTVISSVREEHPDGLTVYNFEVAGLHDYFVSATATDSLVLSHNMCRKGGGAATNGGGRTGDQARLRELGADPNVSSADRGWIKQEQNAIERGQRTRIRRPPGKQLAHERGREAAKGYGYEHSNLQDKDLHKLQHKYDDFGRKNKERPVTDN